MGITCAYGACHFPSRARNYLRHPRRIRERKELAAAIFDRPQEPQAGRIDIDGMGNPPLRGRAALRGTFSVGRALQLYDSRGEPRTSPDQVDPDTRRDGRELVQAKLDLVGLGPSPDICQPKFGRHEKAPALPVP